MIENLVVLAFAFILGACLGSFANVLAIRLHEESSLMGRSKCPACRKVLKPRHLVPIFSWLALHGKCADCGSVIHIQYPLVELTAALLAVVAATRHNPFGPGLAPFLVELVLSIGVLSVVVMDLRWKELPLELMIGLGIFGALANLIIDPTNAITKLYSIVIGVAVAVAFFGAQWILSRGKWLGSGDVWFGAMMGLILGWPGTGVAMYLAYLVGGLVVAVLFLAGIIKRGTSVPFAPALATGFLLSLWFAPAIVHWFSYAF